MKLKFILIAIVAFVLSGCYTSFKTTGYSYAQSNKHVYIDYNFECSHCYYEMYYCFNCTTYHVSINRWCNSHYNWYITWYSYNYHRPYGYYHRHWTQHIYYRDVTRHYVRDRYGIRNYNGRKYSDVKVYVETKRDIYKYKKPPVKRKIVKEHRNTYTRKVVKEHKNTYKRKEIKRYKTQKREIKTYKSPRKNTQKFNTRKRDVQKFKSPTQRNVQKHKSPTRNTQKNTRKSRK